MDLGRIEELKNMKRNYYVIGLDKYCLFQIFWSFPDKLREISYGDMLPDSATRFETLKEAKETINEIAKRYKEIYVHRFNIFDAVINGNDFNLDDIKIYKVWYSMKELEENV